VSVALQTESPKINQVSMPARQAIKADVLLQHGNLTINNDGSITFTAQSLNPNSEIKYSFNTKSNSVDNPKALAMGSQIGDLNNQGYSLLATNSTRNNNARNIYLTIDPKVEKFELEIDGKIYIIDRKDIEDLKSKDSRVVQVTERDSSGQSKALSTNPISTSKYKSLENIRLSPNGEVQFSITTSANDLLLQYARRDGSRSSTGYHTSFRNSYGYGSRLSGAIHEDRTFSLNVNHLSASTVRVDLKLDNQVVNAIVKVGNQSIPINVAELRNYVEQEKARNTLPIGVSPSNSSARGVNSRSPSSASNSSSTPLLASIPKEPQSNVSGNSEENPTTSQSNAAAIGGSAVNRVILNQNAVKPTREKITEERITKELAKNRAIQEKALADKNTVDTARTRIQELKDNAPGNEAAQAKAVEDLKSTQKASFKALDAEAVKLQERMKKFAPETKDYLTAKEELKQNRTLRAELVTERIKLNQELAKSQDPSIKRTAEIELFSLKSPGERAFRVLSEQATDASEKAAIEAKKNEYNKVLEDIEPTRTQKAVEAISTKWEGLKKWASERPIVDKALKFIESAKTKIPGSNARIEMKGTQALDAAKAKVLNGEGLASNTLEDIKRAQILDDALSKDQARLSAKLELTDQEKTKLSEIKNQRTKLAENVKLGLEAEISKATSDTAVAAAKKSLYETWGERIGNCLVGAEKNKFIKQRANFEVDVKLSNTKFLSPEVKSALQKLTATKEAVSKFGDTASESQKLELELQEAQLEKYKVKEILSREVLSDMARAELELRGLKHLSRERRILSKLDTELGKEITNASDPVAKNALEDKQLKVKAELVEIINEKIGTVQLSMSDGAQRVSSEYKEALDKVQQAKERYEVKRTPESELEYRKAQQEAHNKNIARAEFEVGTHQSVIETLRQVQESLVSRINNASGDDRAKLERELAEVKEVVEAKTRILENTINGVNEGKEIKAQQESLAKAQAELIEAQIKITSGADGHLSPEEFETQARKVKALEMKVERLIATHEASTRAKVGLAKLWASTKLHATPYKTGPYKHPLASLFGITVVHSALDGAMRADLDPEAAHSYLPSLLATFSEKSRYWYLGETFKTTAELGEHGENWARWRESISHSIDSSVKFAGVIGAFELATRGTPALYNVIGAKTGIATSQGLAGSAFAGGALAGNRFMAVANPALAAYVSYEMGYGSTAGGQFMTGDTKLVGPIRADHLDIGVPTAASVIMGGAIAGPVGIAGMYALQTVGTYRGIGVALDKLDQDSETFLAQRAVMHSIQRAINGGLYIPPKESRQMGAPEIGTRDNKRYTPAVVQAIDNIAVEDLYEHFIKCAGNSDSDASLDIKEEPKIFLGRELKLSNYSVAELEMLRMVADPKKVNLADSQVVAHNSGIVKDLFSSEKNYSGGANGWDLAAFLNFGSTALENIEDEVLKNKVENDIKAIRDYYDHIYDHSLDRIEVNARDLSSTKEASNYQSYGSEPLLNPGDQNYSKKYAQFLTGSKLFQTHVMDSVSPRQAYNMLEILGDSMNGNSEDINLATFYPGINRILKSPESFSLFKNSFAITSSIGDSSSLAEKDKFHSLGSSLVQFNEYVQSLDSDNNYTQFLSDIKDPTKGLFKPDGSLDERFEQFLPGVSNFILSGDNEGIIALGNIIGDQHSLVATLRNVIADFYEKLPSLDFQDFSSALAEFTNNADRLSKLVDLGVAQGSNGFIELKNNLENGGFNVQRNPATGLVDPAGTYYINDANSRGFVFFRTTRDSKGIEVPVIFNVDRKSMIDTMDPFVTFVCEAYTECSQNDTKSIVFNQTRSFANCKLNDLELISAQVRSDGSVFMTVKSLATNEQNNYIVSPKMNNGNLEWLKREAYMEGDKVVLGRDS
jgi:hypothetical protein